MHAHSSWVPDSRLVRRLNRLLPLCLFATAGRGGADASLNGAGEAGLVGWWAGGLARKKSRVVDTLRTMYDMCLSLSHWGGEGEAWAVARMFVN